MAPNQTPGTFHYHSYIKDSIAVQKRHNYVNDSEEHEANPHLQDFLIPHHTASIGEEVVPGSSNKPKLSRPCISILHNKECPSRHHCEIVESKRHISFKEVTIREYDVSISAIYGTFIICNNNTFMFISSYPITDDTR